MVSPDRRILPQAVESVEEKDCFVYCNPAGIVESRGANSSTILRVNMESGQTLQEHPSSSATHPPVSHLIHRRMHILITDLQPIKVSGFVTDVDLGKMGPQDGDGVRNYWSALAPAY